MLGYRASLLQCATLAAALAGLGHAQPPGPASPQAPDLDARAEAAFAKNDCAGAVPLFKQSLAEATASNDSKRIAQDQLRIGTCAYRQADIETAAAAHLAGVQAAKAAGDLELEMVTTHGVALAYTRLGRLDEALVYAQRERSLSLQCGHAQHQERAIHQTFLVQRALGKIAQAQQSLEEMLGIAREAKDSDGLARATGSLALLMFDLGKYDEAVRFEQEAIAAAGNSEPELRGGLYANLGIYQNKQGRPRDAERSFEQGAKLLDASSNWRVRVAISSDFAELRIRQGKYDAAEDLIRPALRLAEQAKDASMIAAFDGSLAEAMVGRKRLGEAAELASVAVASARQSEAPAILIAALATMGDVRRAQGKADDAVAAYEEAANAVETLRVAAPGDVKTLQGVLDTANGIYRNLVDALLQKGDTARALSWVERSKARVLNDVLLRGGVAELSSMTPEEKREESRLYGALFRTAAGSAQAKAASASLDEFRRKLYAAHPELALQRADFAQAGLEQWRTLLTGDRAALIEFFALPDGTALFVVRKDGVSAFRLAADGKALEARVRRFRAQLASRDVTEGILAQELERTLLGQAAKALASTSDWIVSPDGPLWELPFEALKDGSGKRLLESHSISYTPSLTALWAMRGRPRGKGAADLNLFAVANPSLADADIEVRGIAALFPASKTAVAAGARATADSFLRDAPRADVVHVASHAEFNAASPLYSWLRLGSEGAGETRLTAAELVRVPLRARVVVLSACETARGSGAEGSSGEGEGLMGMGWALTGAGAESSVLSHWKVDSAATSFLMVRFHQELKKPQSPAAALRAAELATMKNPAFAHPFYWASFAVFGDGLRLP